MLCLTCPCHQRNDQLSASWQDYLDTSCELPRLYPSFGECIGSTSGHPRNTGISPEPNNCNFTLIKQRYAGGVFCVMAAQCPSY